MTLRLVSVTATGSRAWAVRPAGRSHNERGSFFSGETVSSYTLASLRFATYTVWSP